MTPPRPLGAAAEVGTLVTVRLDDGTLIDGRLEKVWEMKKPHGKYGSHVAEVWLRDDYSTSVCALDRCTLRPEEPRDVTEMP